MSPTFRWVHGHATDYRLPSQGVFADDVFGVGVLTPDGFFTLGFRVFFLADREDLLDVLRSVSGNLPGKLRSIKSLMFPMVSPFICGQVMTVALMRTRVDPSIEMPSITRSRKCAICPGVAASPNFVM